MITAVDTNVIVDVLAGDPTYGHASAGLLRSCMRQGALVACDIVWAELAAVVPTTEDLDQYMTALGIQFHPLTREAATLAGGMWRVYRQRSGSRARVVADFLIGAHATEQCDRLLTRDRGFYRDYFTGLALIDASAP